MDGPFACKDGADPRRFGDQVERYGEDPAASGQCWQRQAESNRGTVDALEGGDLDPSERQDVVCDPLLRLFRGEH